MPVQTFNLIPPDVFKIFLVLFLSFLIGLQREEKKLSGSYVFGGVRTYPLIGLIGYSMAFLSTGERLPLTAGFLVIGGLMLLSYWHKINSSQDAGLTSEMVGLATYLVGALVYHGYFWMASTLVITSLLLLELKSALEGLPHQFAPDDILTFTKFLFLTAVILPVVPDREFGAIAINPFKTWLIVVAVSGISYGSFLLQKVVKDRGGVLLSALLGGAYSSTATTVALAKQSTQFPRPYSYAGGILIASGIMYLRLAILIGLFNQNLAQKLVLPFGLLAVVGVGGGWLWSAQGKNTGSTSQNNKNYLPPNPLELRAAFLFALLFVAIGIITHYTLLYFGDSGLYALAGIMGVSDIDPFILGLTRAAGESISFSVASAAIAIAAASNNVLKGIYAVGFGDRQAGRQSCGLLFSFALLGLIPLFWLLSGG